MNCARDKEKGIVMHINLPLYFYSVIHEKRSHRMRAFMFRISENYVRAERGKISGIAVFPMTA